MADTLDRYELYMTEPLALAVEPLIARLRRRTLTRPGYERLCAIIVQNALTEGQSEATEAALLVIHDHWTRCPGRYLPPWKLRPALTIRTIPS